MVPGTHRVCGCQDRELWDREEGPLTAIVCLCALRLQEKKREEHEGTERTGERCPGMKLESFSRVEPEVAC